MSVSRRGGATRAPDFDVAVVGAGPVGCAAALAHARAGARVLLLEARPKACQRLAGEWLHPRGVAALRELEAAPDALAPYETGRGFAVHAGDGSAPVLLPYAEGARGWSGEHARLVEALRDAAAAHPNVTLELGARASAVHAGELEIARASPRALRVRAGWILGADGRRSRVRAALGLPDGRAALSRMAGLRLESASLPDEGFGHVFLGAPGPMLAYRIAKDALRLCLDVPLGAAADRAWLRAAYTPALPEELRDAFERALRDGELAWALNQARLRTCYGRPGLALLGDAVGFQHPLTAAGMTLGLCDATLLARTPDFAHWQRARAASCRVPELLGAALYEAFSAGDDAGRALQRGVFALWRRSARSRERSMRFLAAEDGQTAAFAATFARVAAPALAAVVARSAVRGDGRGARAALRTAATHAAALLRGAPRAARELPAAEAAAHVLPPADAQSAEDAIARGVQALAAAQREDGRWEGEVIWCPMLAAQYVLLAAAIALPLAPERRERLLLQFERTQRADGLWGLHARSEPYLFVTALVYVAARLLGEAGEGALLSRARAFIGREDVVAIPSWGKLWLALVGLYDWRGVPPTVPELWALPRALPFHPSRFYCHTRHIYLAMSALYARRVSAPDTPRLREIRSELYPHGMKAVDWRRARSRLRGAELVTPPGRALRAFYRALALYDRFHARGLRARLVAALDARMRFELRSTDFTCLSPVSGMLGLLALHASDPADPDLRRGIERLEAWMWDDGTDGLRIAGARSATWDTSFALQALAQARSAPRAEPAIARGVAFLREQQIRQTSQGHRSAFRLDPRGGFCFAGAWHGWPVSDCTAEALEALARAGGAALGRDAERAAVRFLLRCQNPDGGFGSYEARRTRVGLEWLNPAEMFGESMTEHSYVECTASCLAALADFRRRRPEDDSRALRRASARAERRLRRLQRADGSWRGVWGVQFVYGTLFGVRGLVAAGAAANDPAVQRACAWLLARQRADGSWGERADGCARAEYAEHGEGQVVHTAWALLALLEAEHPSWSAIARGAQFLFGAQREDGSWPAQDPAGLFFRTALLDYALYRAYFPLMALARYEQRRRRREAPAHEEAAR